MLCKPPLSEIQEKFQHPKQETSFSLRSHSSFSPAPVSWKLQIHFLSEWLCLFWTFYINRNIQVDSSLCSKVNVWCNLWAVSIYCFPPFCSWDMLSCLFVYIVVFCWKVNTFTMIMSNLGKWHLCQTVIPPPEVSPCYSSHCYYLSMWIFSMNFVQRMFLVIHCH